MGDLKGHLIPGTFFLFYGICWAVGCLWKYISSRRSETPYVSTLSYRLTCFSGIISRIPAQPLILIGMSSSGILGETLTHLPSPSPAIVQHVIMYFFFLLSAIVDLCCHYGLPLPHGVDYISMVLALTVEGLLFVSHVHGRTMLDVHIHLMLVYIIATTVIVIILEIRFQKSVILGMARAYLMMLHGTWFYAIGIMLYGHDSNNSWDETSEESVMQATIYFCWHCAVHFILLLLLTLIMSYCYNRKSDRQLSHNFTISDKEKAYDEVAFHQINNDSEDEFETVLPSVKS